MSHLPLLQELGLSPNEAKIYEALLTYGTLGVSTISLRAKVHRRNAYDALERLHEKGLVFQVYGKGETLYAAVDPGKLMELIQEKEMKLTSIMPDLEKTFREHRAPEQAYIYKGIEGVKNYLRKVLDCGSDMYILGAEGAWFDPRIATYTKWFLREAKHKELKINAIFDEDARDLSDMKELFQYPHKFLPDSYDTKSTMDIFGDYIVSYTGTAPGRLREDATIFVLYSPDLAESYRTWWKCVWDLLPSPKNAKSKGK